MFRRFFSSFAAHRESMRTRLAGGNIFLLGAGMSGLGALGFWVSSQRELAERRQLELQFDAMLAAERVKARADEAATAERLRNAPVLWRGVVTMSDSRLQGHKMLRGSSVGAGVDVLEQSTGDHGKYLTVRDRQTGQSGLILESWVRPETA